jgi:hypothetical protein
MEIRLLVLDNAQDHRVRFRAVLCARNSARNWASRGRNSIGITSRGFRR